MGKSLARHTAIVITALLLIVGVPVFRTGFFQRKLSGADTVSSATVVLEQPSGAYVVWLNRSHHPNADNLRTWEEFFRGEEIGYLFEDISCMVADLDSGGLELAKSFQSRLPENQMKIRKEDLTLMLSKAQNARYDVILMSKEIYEASGASQEEQEENTVVIEAEGI